MLETTTEVFWRAMHSVYVEAFEELPDEARDAILQRGHVTFEFFIELLNHEVLRVMPLVNPDDVPCLIIEGQCESGDYVVLAGIEAERLNIDPTVIADAVARGWDDAFERLVDLPGGGA